MKLWQKHVLIALAAGVVACLTSLNAVMQSGARIEPKDILAAVIAFLVGAGLGVAPNATQMFAADQTVEKVIQVVERAAPVVGAAIPQAAPVANEVTKFAEQIQAEMPNATQSDLALTGK